jgi:hypothetical protein
MDSQHKTRNRVVCDCVCVREREGEGCALNSRGVRLVLLADRHACGLLDASHWHCHTKQRASQNQLPCGRQGNELRK